jgi:hypothetical protein
MGQAGYRSGLSPRRVAAAPTPHELTGADNVDTDADAQMPDAQPDTEHWDTGTLAPDTGHRTPDTDTGHWTSDTGRADTGRADAGHAPDAGH